MKKINLSAQKRTLVGRKVKNLRQQNLLPGNIFGKNIASVSISIPQDEFTRVFTQAGETGLIELQLDKETRPVLVKNVQLHPVNSKFLHVDFYQVDLKEKVTANVPIKLEGSAVAVDQKLGVLLELTDEVEVEALPTDLPEAISVDVTKLAAVGDTLKVADLVLPPGVLVLTPADTEIVKVGELVSKEVEAEAAAAEAAAQAAAAASAETPTEGVAAPTETVAEGKKPEAAAAAAKPKEESK